MSKPKGRFNPVTKKGYGLFDVSSALQKSIRRGKTQDALYWAFELWQSNFEKYLWKRLLIMAVEDVGLASPRTMHLVQLLYNNYKAVKEMDPKTKESGRPIMAAVYVLATSKHSSFLNWVWCHAYDFHDSKLLDIPEYALDMHTRRGKANGKNIYDFFDDGSQLANHVEIENEAELKEQYREFFDQTGMRKWTAHAELPAGHKDRVYPKKDEDYDDEDGDRDDGDDEEESEDEKPKSKKPARPRKSGGDGQLVF